MHYLYSIKKLFFKHFELTILFIALTIWLGGLYLFKLPLALPDLGSANFIFNHYLKPICIIMLIQVLITIIIPRKDKTYKNKNDFKDIIFLFFFFMLICFFHFTFKIWTPLVNPSLFDTLYNKIDIILHTNLLIVLGKKLNIFETAAPFYHYLFVALFFISFLYHFIFDSFNNFRKIVIGTALVLLLGGLSYWICPALGPFSLFPGDSYKFIPDFKKYQEIMFSLYSQMIAYKIIPPGYFINPPAAMPSLHIANSLFLFFMMKRLSFSISLLYLLFIIYLVIMAIASGWHYFIDLVFGALLACICLKIVDKVYK